jgi:hypothetical protein
MSMVIFLKVPHCRYINETKKQCGEYNKRAIQVWQAGGMV